MAARAGGLFISGAAMLALAWSVTAFARQEARTPEKEAKPPLVIQVGVDLIQIDAAVTGKDGRPVTDLRTEDFSIEIDGKKQPVSNATFFDSQPASAAGLEGSSEPAGPPQPRSLLFLIDDLNVSFFAMASVREDMKRFAEKWESRDVMVGLRLTSDESAAVRLSRKPQAFRESIEKLRFNLRGQEGSVPSLPGTRAIGELSISNSGNSPAMERAIFQQRVFSILTTLNALRAIPGRKAVVFVSEGFVFWEDPQGNERRQMRVSSPFSALFDDRSAGSALRLIVEVANRASVVIYTLDPSGLRAGGGSAELSAPPSMGSLAAATELEIANHGTLQEMAQDTGGLSVYNRNDLRRGLRDVVDDQRSYYLIGFEPPTSAFEKASDKPRYHRITLTVNRSDVRVRTRAGFYGVTDREVIKRAPLMTAGH